MVEVLAVAPEAEQRVYDCDHGCDVEGLWDVVAQHELSCPLRETAAT